MRKIIQTSAILMLLLWLVPLTVIQVLKSQPISSVDAPIRLTGLDYTTEGYILSTYRPCLSVEQAVLWEPGDNWDGDKPEIEILIDRRPVDTRVIVAGPLFTKYDANQNLLGYHAGMMESCFVLSLKSGGHLLSFEYISKSQKKFIYHWYFIVPPSAEEG